MGFGYAFRNLVMENSGIFYGYLVYVPMRIMEIWYILYPLGIFLPVLVCCTKKNSCVPFMSETQMETRFFGETFFSEKHFSKKRFRRKVFRRNFFVGETSFSEKLLFRRNFIFGETSFSEKLHFRRNFFCRRNFIFGETSFSEKLLFRRNFFFGETSFSEKEIRAIDDDARGSRCCRVKLAKKAKLFKLRRKQGCQIFLNTIHQNGERYNK
jgi:hypothetical protein